MGERLRRAGNRGSLVLFVVVLLLLLVNNFISLPYYVFAPGSAHGVKDAIEVPAEKRFSDNGDFMMTTVALSEARPLQLLYASLSPTQRVEKKASVSGDLSREEFSRINEAEMTNSQQVAIAVGMQRSGYKVDRLGDGALIKQVINDAPLRDLVKVGEVIVGIDGKPVGLATDLTDVVGGVSPGQKVTLAVKGAEGGEQRTVDVVAGPNPQDSSKALLGVLVTTDNARLDTPFPVEFKDSDVGGPSAGLAFTLALIDSLTPGALSGGKKVATTGTIDADGSVGEVGGVAQKAAAVEKAGIELFVVPDGEVDDAKSAVGDGVKVVGVKNLDEALDALKQNGGDISGIPVAASLNQVAS